MRKNGEPAAKDKFSSILLGSLGVVMGLLLCGLPLFLLYSSGFLIPSANASRPTLALPTATAPFFSPTPSATNTQIPTATLITVTPDVAATNQADESKASSFITQARMKIANNQYSEAIPILDEAISIAPNLDEPYFLRAMSYFHLLENQRNYSEYEDYVSLGLKDIDQAITLRSDDGNYYFLRHSFFDELAGITDYRVDRIEISSLALENAKMALDLGTTEEFPERYYVVELINSDRCGEAKESIQELIIRTHTKDTSIEGLYMLQSRAYACLGDLNNAISMIDKSISYSNSAFNSELKAGYLYQAGRNNEALKILNDLIEKHPSYGGNRYYQRAVIYLDKGDRKKAEEDLVMGAGNTWFHAGLYSYVLGEMALADGKTEEAISQFQNAEATLGGNDNVFKAKSH